MEVARIARAEKQTRSGAMGYHIDALGEAIRPVQAVPVPANEARASYANSGVIREGEISASRGNGGNRTVVSSEGHVG